VPISTNQAYAKKRGSGARILTKKGKKYKNETKAYIAKHYPQALLYFKPQVPYVVVVEFTFHGREHLYTKGWDDPKSDCQNRYKTLDVSNRLKLFEDALASATAVDDKHNFAVLLSKTWARDFERTDAWVWSRELEPENPVDELLRTLRAAQPH
jgi:hypothetical protein